MSKIHYGEHYSSSPEDIIERTPCGHKEISEYVEYTNDWGEVTCKKCLRMKKRIQEDEAAMGEAFEEFAASHVEFMEKEMSAAPVV